MYLGVMLTLLFIGAGVVLCTSERHISNSHCNNEVDIGEAVNNFGSKLFIELSKEQGNIVFSPFSIHASLALLTLGTEEKTQKELLAKLSFCNINHLKEGYLKFINRFLNSTTESLLIANGVFLDKTHPLLESFITDAGHIFKANAQNVNYGDPDSAAAVINDWVADKTHHAIPEIVKKNTLGETTILMLLNAIYFNGKWKVAFDKSKTVQTVFETPSGDVTCDLMVIDKVEAMYLEKRHFQLLEMSFREENIKIAFVRPKRKESKALGDVEKVLKGQALFKTIGGLRTRLMNIRIPKFNASKTYTLEEQLISIGISDIFKTPDLSKLFAGKPDVFVNKVSHEAIVQVSEEGVVAAAASAVGMAERTGPPTFTLNRPFLFYLYDTVSEIILVRGIVLDPTL